MDENWGPYDLGNPHKYHKSPKVVGRCEIHRMAKISMQKKAKPIPKVHVERNMPSILRERQKLDAKTVWKQLTRAGDESPKKIHKFHRFPPFSHIFCLLIPGGWNPKKPAFWAHTHLLQKSSCSAAVLNLLQWLREIPIEIWSGSV